MIPRRLKERINKMLEKFPVVSVTGPRQAGKTTLLRNYFPDFKYFNLERIDHRDMILSDIVGFLKNTGTKVIFDEVQNVPELFSYIQVISDERNEPGQYILSGSQSFLLNKNISQSLAGRVSVNHLLPFDIFELPQSVVPDRFELILTGFYPRIYDKNIAPEDFYPSYLQTYIERDIRTLKSVKNLNLFSRFLGLCAGRVGQILNLSSLANDAGISVNTAKEWISLLESSFILYLLQPYYRNFNKRIIKSPKLYFYDTGVASSLLRLYNKEAVMNHYAFGSLFENLVINEIIKTQTHLGKRPSIYYWRESNGAEIDCIFETPDNSIAAIEIKAGETFSRSYINNLVKYPYQEEIKSINKLVVYGGDTRFSQHDIEIIPWKEFPEVLKKIVM